MGFFMIDIRRLQYAFKHIGVMLFFLVSMVFPVFNYVFYFFCPKKDYVTHVPVSAVDNVHAGARDFMYFWGTGHFINEGHIHDLTKVQYYLDYVQSYGSHATSVGLWAYPPTINFFICFWALFPYMLGYALFVLCGLALSYYAFRTLCSRSLSLMAMTSPLMVVLLIYGQISGYVCGLLVLGLSLLYQDTGGKDRSLLAGFLFGLCLVKYPFMVLVPFVLLYRKSYKAFISMCVTSLVLIVATLLLWGIGPWKDYFLVLGPLMSQDMMHHVNLIFITPVTSLVQQGVPHSIAWGVQSVVTLGSIVLACKSFSLFSRVRDAIVFISGLTLIASPYSHTYDFIFLAPVMSILLVTLYKKTSLKAQLGLIFTGFAWFWMGLCNLFTMDGFQFTGMPLFNCALVMSVLSLFVFVQRKEGVHETVHDVTHA